MRCSRIVGASYALESMFRGFTPFSKSANTLSAMSSALVKCKPKKSATPFQKRFKAWRTLSNTLATLALSNTPSASDIAFSLASAKRFAPCLPESWARTSSANASSSSANSGYRRFVSFQIGVPRSKSFTFSHSAGFTLRKASAHKCVYSWIAVSSLAILGSR